MHLLASLGLFGLLVQGAMANPQRDGSLEMLPEEDMDVVAGRAAAVGNQAEAAGSQTKLPSLQIHLPSIPVKPFFMSNILYLE